MRVDSLALSLLQIIDVQQSRAVKVVQDTMVWYNTILPYHR